MGVEDRRRETTARRRRVVMTRPNGEIEEQNARATWVCSICGENTADVDYDYIGSGTNHLQCELKLELEEEVIGGRVEFEEPETKHFADGFHEGRWEDDIENKYTHDGDGKPLDNLD